MKTLDQYSLDDLKRVYRHLHNQLQEDFELMDSDLLQDIQTLLQSRAREEGVDVSVHAQWAAWLNDGVQLRSI